MNCKEVLSLFRLHGESQNVYDMPRVKRGREMWETERSCFEEGGGDKQLRSERVPSSGTQSSARTRLRLVFQFLCVNQPHRYFLPAQQQGLRGHLVTIKPHKAQM